MHKKEIRNDVNRKLDFSPISAEFDTHTQKKYENCADDTWHIDTYMSTYTQLGLRSVNRVIKL